MTEQWRQQMREKMADYRKPAPEVAWDEIEQAVAASRHVASTRWLRRVAAAALVLLLAGAGGYWALTTEQTEEASNPCLVVRTVCPMEKPVCDTVAPEPQQAVKPRLSRTTVRQVESHSVAVAEPEEGLPVADTAVVAPAKVPEKRAVPRRHQNIKVVYPSNLHRSSTNRLTAKVYMANIMANSRSETSSRRIIPTTTINETTVTEDGTGSGIDFDGETADWDKEGENPDDNPAPPPDATSPHTYTKYDTITTYKELQEGETVRHYQPVRFGVSLRYQLDDRWSLEAGLSYTRLTSEITKNVNNVFTTTKIHTDYIGIPLNVAYHLWATRYMGIYTSAGGTVEKATEGSLWQFSLNGAVGVELKLARLFSLYAEPGLGYFFDNGSSVPTLYQEKPLNFNLSFGLRVHLK